MSESAAFSCTLPEPPFSQKEVLRYMGCRNANGDVTALAESVKNEAMPLLHYRVCWRELPLESKDNLLLIGGVPVQSRHLAKALTGCSRVLLFGATLGIEIDRLIAKYSRTLPSRALALQAFATERVEALCDAFLAERSAVYQESSTLLRPRFSPGYGDLPLGFQAELFRWLDCSRKIGLSLNESLLMSPTKSVTALVGLMDAER
jgi:5-methyltetrahydrofolate--homocysteine methyltransferase